MRFSFLFGALLIAFFTMQGIDVSSYAFASNANTGISPANSDKELLEIIFYIVGAIFIVLPFLWVITLMSGSYKRWKYRNERALKI